MWKYYFKDCGGYEQFLINIVLKDIFFELRFVDFVVNYENNVFVKLFNNGYIVQVIFLIGKFDIFGGNLIMCFCVLQMYFYWGSKNLCGLEYQVGGRKFFLEIYIVYYNVEKYFSVLEVLKKGDGLVVLGILVEFQV